MSAAPNAHDGSSRSRILALLRRGERSVDELASAVGVTDNAVRLHLATLERDGLIRASRLRREGQVGKPATVYAITAEGDDAFSRGYEPVLTSLLVSLAGRLTARELNDVLRDVGRQLASSASRASARGREDRSMEALVHEAAELLRAIGGDAEVRKTDEGFVIQSFACPLSRSVEACPPLCGAIEELVAGVTGGKVRERCDRTGRPRCSFVIASRATRR